MSKSLRRVTEALARAGIAATPLEMPDETRTAEQAAAAAGCALDQIVKSILFRGDASGRMYLFLTAGGNRVETTLAAAVAGEPLGRADAAEVRQTTGFAIGGVAPVGLLSEVPTYFDPRLLDFPFVWAAAGTPRHIFSIAPGILAAIAKARTAQFTTR